MTELKHFTFDKIKREDCAINFVGGARRIGKTMALMQEMTDTFNAGYQSVLLRDYANQFTFDYCDRLLKDAQAVGICPPEWVALPGKGVFTGDDPGADRVAYFQPVNRASGSRGSTPVGVRRVLFDEYIPEIGHYPAECATALMSIITSYTSAHPEAKFFGVSNFVGYTNPYFVKFKVYPDVRKDVTVFKDASIAIEIARGYKSALLPESPMVKALQRGGYASYAEPDELSVLDLIKRSNKGKIFHFYLYVDGRTYQMREHDGRVYISNLKGNRPSHTYLVTNDSRHLSSQVSMLPKWLFDMLKDAFHSSRLRFDTPNTMFDIIGIFYKQ